ncbi:cyclic nucleotide-binding domain-containing protein [Aurantiacibacter odishensis]|uniref:cyclic nucleotide-binding domain-containing protein n=1 Tax=Aurantiacibacter odishensis TaxID=1155476 RepID=UPI000E740692|nr:cyclic nucleotide-binding domain-containing protein [Aurantiacibacter odishensis]
MDLFDAAILLHAGAVVYVIAFLFRDEALIRGFSVLGTLLYMGYYFWYPPEPLWDPIITSTIFLAANVVVIFMILLERTTFQMSDDEKRLFAGFDTLTPGEFRRLLKLAEWHDSDGSQVLTEAGKKPEKLHYVLDGDVLIEKDGTTFPMSEGRFIGEIGYVLGEAATGTVRAPEGTRYVSWNVADLTRLSHRKPAIGIALSALLGEDLARKLATSVHASAVAAT